MKISIITPSYNSGGTIERAIKSVLTQNYNNFEHIIVDGGSVDNTIPILKKYKQLKWISEPDRGQVEAIKKGLSMAEGEIIAYLNADDFYLQGAFDAVIPYFMQGEKVVMGKVLVRSEKPGKISEWICDSKTDFHSALRHWELNAFCVNPVGYFTLREVQEKVPLKEEAGSKHDLEFLIGLSLHYPIKKIDYLLGVFNHNLDTQTAREQLTPGYWQSENFSFIDDYASNLMEKERKQFYLERDRGYQYRRLHTVKEALAAGKARDMFKQEEIFLLPEDENECYASGSGFVEHDRLAARGDWIVPVFISGKVASKSICHTLKSLPENVLPAQVYHVHQMNPNTICRHLPRFLPERSHAAVGLALKKLYDNKSLNLQWKFIAGVRDPVSGALSGVFENWPDVKEEDIQDKLSKILKYRLNHFEIQYLEPLGINVYDYPFDYHKKFQVIEERNSSVLIYRLEELPEIFPAAMQEYLGLENLKLSRVNLAEEKKYAKRYQEIRDKIGFDQDFLQEIYDHHYVKHFYTEAEIERFMNRWGKPGRIVSGTTLSSNAPDCDVKDIPYSRNYIIFFVPRSGSTLLTELLVRTGVLGNPQEWLNKHCFGQFKQKYGYNTSALDDYIRTVKKEQRTENRVFGMEMAHHQFNILEGEEQLWSHFDQSTRVIFLRRENVLDQAVSFYKSRKTDIWHLWSEQPDLEPVAYDRAEMIKSFKTIVNEEINLINLFIRKKIKPLIITYEEINASHIQVLNKIASFMDLSLPQDLDLENIALKKIGKEEEVGLLISKFIPDARKQIVKEITRLEEAYTNWGVKQVIKLPDIL